MEGKEKSWEKVEVSVGGALCDGLLLYFSVSPPDDDASVLGVHLEVGR